MEEIEKNIFEINLPWMHLLNKSILVTGATGLIGSYLVDVLMFRNINKDESVCIYALGRNEEVARKRFSNYWGHPCFKWIKHDVIEPIYMDVKIDYIIHAACDATPNTYNTDPVGVMRANLWGLNNLLLMAAEMKARLLFLSSGEIYGGGIEKELKEDDMGYLDILNPRSSYPSSKRAAETLCVAYRKQYHTDVVIARPGHIYGFTDREKDNRVFMQFARMVNENKDITLLSEGMQVRSFCYVLDCAIALLYILLKGNSGEAYNIANRVSNVSIRDFAREFALQRNCRVIYNIKTPLSGCSLISNAVLDASKLEALGWKAHYTLGQGVKSLLDKSNSANV